MMTYVGAESDADGAYDNADADDLTPSSNIRSNTHIATYFILQTVIFKLKSYPACKYFMIPNQGWSR